MGVTVSSTQLGEIHLGIFHLVTTVYFQPLMTRLDFRADMGDWTELGLAA
jgi:hypothetical protein